MELSRKTIWAFEQNKPSLVVDDLARYAPRDVVYASLLRRGIFKWLTVRRDLIKLKDQWKARLRRADSEYATATGYHRAVLKGYRKALTECRQEVRGLCHSERWAAPDFDRRAQAWLASLDKTKGSR